MSRSVYSNPQPAPAWRRPAIIGGVIALAVVAGILLALFLTREPLTGSGDPSPSPRPSPTASPSESGSPSAEPEPSESPTEEPDPTATPSASPAPSEQADSPYRDPVVAAPDGVLPPGGVVRVVADAIRVREQPMRSSAEQATVARGELLVVGPTFGYGLFGPEVADGYTWYPVGTLGTDELPEPGGAPLEFAARGWVAIGDGESEWVELLDPRCTDDEASLELLSSLTEWERLACYGDAQITFEGVLGCGGCGGMMPGTFTPEWLAFPMNMDFISVEPQELIGPMALRWSPDGQERPDTNGVAPILRVTGHFDDAAADGCSMVFLTDTFGVRKETEVDPAISELFCREQFVVESYEIIGEDEDFPFG